MVLGMKKGLYSFVVCLSFLVGCQNDKVNELELISFYDEFLMEVNELFAYHTYEEEMFFNEKYHTEESIRSILAPYMTEEGMNQFLADHYIQEDQRFVYNGEFQDYLRDYSRNSSYYDITRQTIFNPGLRMISRELEVNALAEEVELRADGVPVRFYSEESMYGQTQFGELGYPAVDHLSLTVKMVKDKDEYRIQYVEVDSET